LAANAQLELAKNLLAVGNQAQAVQEAAGGCAVAEALSARNQNVARWRQLETMCFDLRSRLALASADNGEALDYAKRALAAARAGRSGDAIYDRYAIAAAARLLGDIRQRAGDSGGARAAWSDGLSQLPANVSERPQEMNERAALLQRLGRNSDARPLTERLAAIGYRSAI
jgi:hypothetical protein